MFSDNNRISPRGMFRLVLTEGIGAVLLFSLFLSDELLPLYGGAVLTAAWLLSLLLLKWFFSFGITFSSRHPKAMKLFVHIRGAFLAFGALSLLAFYLNTELLPGTSPLFLCLTVFATAFLIGRKPVEIRCRLCELLCPIIVLPALITLIFSITTIDFTNTERLLALITDTGDFTLTLGIRLLLLALLGAFFCSPWDFFSGDDFPWENANDAYKTMKRASTCLYLPGLVQFLTGEFTYQIHPVLSVSAGIVLYISAALHAFLPKSKNGKIQLAYGLSLLLAAYLTLLSVPAFQVSGTKFIDAKELESRSFVLSLIITEHDGRYSYLCELADYSKEEEVTSRYLTVSSPDSYAKVGGKSLDFSHIDGIVTDCDNLSEEELRNLIRSLARRYRIPGDALFFEKKEFPKTYDYLLTESEEHRLRLGDTLKTLAKNQKLNKSYTLRAFISKSDGS